MQQRRLAQPSGGFAGDMGHADPDVRRIMASASDQVGYVRALVALCTARLIMPIVASGDETPHHDPDRHAEMAAVLVTGATGERALLGFTGIDALTAWNRGARPVLCTLDDLAATVPEAGAEALVLDIAGPTPFTIEQDVLAQLSAGRRLVELDDGTFGWVMAS